MPEIVYHTREFVLRCCRRDGHRQHRDIPWAIRNGHSNARPAVISAALIRAAAAYGGAAVNLRRIAICEQSTDHMGSGTNVAELKARQLKDVAGSWDQASN